MSAMFVIRGYHRRHTFQLDAESRVSVPETTLTWDARGPNPTMDTGSGSGTTKKWGRTIDRGMCKTVKL